MTIHHFYRAYHIVFHNDHYQVQNDNNPQDPWCDVTLHLGSLRSAKAYVDALWEVQLYPMPEPLGSMRLEPFYRSAYRPNAPLPSAFHLRNKPIEGRCHHAGLRVDPVGMHAGSLWCFCNQPVANAGTTRCRAHQSRH